MQYSRILLLMTIQCLYFANAVRQRCNSPTFSCEYNNPCDPECVPGQTNYPGPSDITYVQCVNGECTKQRCPRRSTWNQNNLRCEGRNGVEARCAFPTFDCADRNPCESTLCEQDVNNYPGPGPKTYVSCESGCSEEKCDRRQVWDQDAQRCVRRSGTCTQLDLIHYPDTYSDYGSYISDYTTLDQCIDGCLADVNCYGLDWDSWGYCYHHYEQSNLDTRKTYSGDSQFVKPPACF